MHLPCIQQYLQAAEGRDKTHTVCVSNAVGHGAGVLNIGEELCNNTTHQTLLNLSPWSHKMTFYYTHCLRTIKKLLFSCSHPTSAPS